MRKYNPSHLSSSNANSCENSPHTGCTWTYSKVGSTDYNKAPRVLSQSASFSHCEWIHCTGSRGGALYSTTNGNVLTLNSCLLDGCCSTEDYGGGIYTTYLGSVNIQNTLFLSCYGKQTSNTNSGGGGAYFERTQVSLTIHNSDFIRCFTGADGGGLNLYSHDHSLSDSFQSLRFVGCESTPRGGGREGGAIQVNAGVFSSKYIDCLFALCSAQDAGAMWINVGSISTEESAISFCFFHKNTASR